MQLACYERQILRVLLSPILDNPDHWGYNLCYEVPCQEALPVPVTDHNVFAPCSLDHILHCAAPASVEARGQVLVILGPRDHCARHLGL